MNQTSIQLYQPTDVQGEYIALPYLPQEMIDLIFKIKTILEDADKKALEIHKYNLNFVHHYILSAIDEIMIVNTGFMILDNGDPLKGKYIPGTYNNYLKVKQLPYFKRAFADFGENEDYESNQYSTLTGTRQGTPFCPYYDFNCDDYYCYDFAEPWRKE